MLDLLINAGTTGGAVGLAVWVAVRYELRALHMSTRHAHRRLDKIGAPAAFD